MMVFLTVQFVNPTNLNRIENCVLIQQSWSTDLSFPPNFKFGAATAAYQVEGGWNADGKGMNIWDRYVHEYPDDIRNRSTGDVAADSYHQWRQDVKAAAQMRLQTYRFSINWVRILPSGFTNEINKAGAQYYSDLIDALLAEGIEPIVTLFHWDLPVKIQDLGGWTNPLIVKWFGDYARVVYTLYSSRVRTWLTMNEPVAVCDYYYNSERFPPRVKESMYAPYLCNKYIMLAHANAYRIFEREFKPSCPGRISLANNVLWIEPFSPNDTELAELGRQYQTGRYSHPIFSKQGGWPPLVEKFMLELSLKQGFAESRLPPFTAEEIEFMKGTADFYGINFYTTSLIRPSKPKEEPGLWFITGSPELNAMLEPPPNAYYGALSILPVTPESMRKQFKWLTQQYGDIEILVTENGYSTFGHQLDDYDRADFIKEHLEQVLLSIKVDNINVTGYLVWSLIDNFEWLDGYRAKFGLYEVDFDHPNRTRTPRFSANYYACVIAERSLDVPDSCHNKIHSVHRIRRTEQNGGNSTNRGLLLNILALICSYLLMK
ncbi:myrosinase 1 isoform X2 [Bicyclus anynana]|uniref:Myrosinase 1 isoform X2 n=1 Tax=Bicyclus anynana TaxID=110368 RepID=A0A6J1P0E0_BICAN|nr:myrosinase 1 isoform X2 [Bicyclus anynana]